MACGLCCGGGDLWIGRAWRGVSGQGIAGELVGVNMSLHHGVSRGSGSASCNGTVEVYHRQATKPAIIESPGGSNWFFKSGS